MTPNQTQNTQDEAPLLVDPKWLLRTIGLLIGAALVCGYLTLCLLFWQGQWQLVLHPAETGPVLTPAAAQMKFDDLRFDLTPAGQPLLHGWWIPGGANAATTVLYLHSGDGTLTEALPRLVELHEAGVNVLAFDYRGYGQSAGPHPTQLDMQQDAEAAWEYLAQERKVAPQTIVPYGDGVGASLAVQVAAAHGSSAVILSDPDFDVREIVRRDPRTRLIPVKLLFHEDFPLEPTLGTLQAQKLVLPGNGESRAQSLSRFLSEYRTGAVPNSQ